MATNVPLTVQTGLAQNYGSTIAIGGNVLNLDYQLQNVYWAVVLDRTNLNVLENFSFSDNNDVPQQLVPYLNNNQYILILTTQNLASTNLPAGSLYKLLTGEGSGAALEKIEQIYESLSCGTWGWMSYLLVTVLDNSASFDYSDYYNNAMVNCLQLIPVQVGTGVLYTPSSL